MYLVSTASNEIIILLRKEFTNNSHIKYNVYSKESNKNNVLEAIEP